MPLHWIKRAPPRIVLVNLVTMEEFRVLMNPEMVVERLRVNYGRLGIVGMSHQLLQYQSTGNTTYPLQFTVNKIVADEQELLEDREILDFKRFLLALTVPPAGASSVRSGSPPSVLFLWSQAGFSMTCKLVELQFEFQMFSVESKAMIYVASVTLEETRDQRMTSEELRELGTLRAVLPGAAPRTLE